MNTHLLREIIKELEEYRASMHFSELFNTRSGKLE